MGNLVPVSRERHSGRGLRQSVGYGFAATWRMIPLLAGEFAKIAVMMPIAFIEQSGRYVPVAVMSPVEGRNLFVGPAGQWLGGYIPAVLRSYPFLLRRVEGGDSMTLFIDEDCGLIVDVDGDAKNFFEEDGSPSAAVNAALNFLQQVEQNRSVTDLAVAALAEAGLMTAWPLKVSINNEPQTVSGLHRMDETKLNALDDELFLKLRKSGALPLAYMQLLSMGQVAIYAQLGRLQQQLAPAPAQEKPFSLDDFFAQAHNETLRFN